MASTIESWIHGQHCSGLTRVKRTLRRSGNAPAEHETLTGADTIVRHRPIVRERLCPARNPSSRTLTICPIVTVFIRSWLFFQGGSGRVGEHRFWDITRSIFTSTVVDRAGRQGNDRRHPPQRQKVGGGDSVSPRRGSPCLAVVSGEVRSAARCVSVPLTTGGRVDRRIGDRAPADPVQRLGGYRLRGSDDIRSRARTPRSSGPGPGTKSWGRPCIG